MTKPATPPSDDMALAAEYALGLLEGPARIAFEARLRNEQPLRKMVARWQIEFAEMTGDIEPVAPPPEVKSVVMAGLTTPKRELGVWGWLGSTLVGSALAVSIVMLVFIPPKPDFVPSYLAELRSESSDYQINATLSADGSHVRVVRIAGASRGDRVLEMWVIAGDNPPVSLGVLVGSDGVTELPQELRNRIAGLVLAVSDEPPGGSPTGAPTGEILATATINSL